METYYSTRDFCEEVLRSLPLEESTKINFGKGKGNFGGFEFRNKDNRIGYLTIENLENCPYFYCLFFFMFENQYVYRKIKLDKKPNEILKTKNPPMHEDPLDRILYVMEKTLLDFKRKKTIIYTSEELNGLLFDASNYPNGGII